MSRNILPPQGDPHPTSALYLSRLDHEYLYSDAELRRAVADTVAALGGTYAVDRRYADALHKELTRDRDRCEARRSWALRTARELALGRAGGARRIGAGAPAGGRSAPLRGAS
ncbi:hypothetical protein [Streptomyces sp. GC420]|uniref:hypothetical protein n=1 Tax=Streptomyces sp. GC420 TaxID=2697568 RepID=UPI001414F292|nr:hypothetical protein [Streptomyces sp. GC420]NBM18570.1 hypothetical protein [Streptomyces sp. GC420]